MTRLSYQQIEDLWTSNGGSSALAPTMAAIAQAESGGRTDALNNNPSTGDYSVGLWQINYFDGMLGPRTQRYGSPSALQADPNLQAKAAISLAGDGSGLSNWSTYTSGAYKSHMSGAPFTGGAGATDTQAAAASGSTGVSGCAVKMPSVAGIGGGCIISNANIKALKGGLLIVAGGTLLVVGGLVLVAFGFQRTGAGQAATRAAGVLPGPAKTVADLAGGAGRAVSRPRPRPVSAAKPSYGTDPLNELYDEFKRNPGPTRSSASYRAARRLRSVDANALEGESAAARRTRRSAEGFKSDTTAA